MPDAQNDKQYTTRDLYLATTLITLKFEMKDITYQYEGMRPNPVGYFSFEDSEDLHQTVKKYNQGLLTCEPKTFITNMRSLKAEINNFQKNPHRAGADTKTAP